MQIPDSSDLISLDKAARIVSLNRETLRYHFKRHPDSPTVEIDGRTYVFGSKLAAWNSSRKKKMHRRIIADV